MVPSEVVRVVLPNVKLSVPGGGGLAWRIWSRITIASVGFASKGYLKLQRSVRVDGMEKFLEVLENKRDRGILTVSNHFLDDPMLWGILPARVLVDPRKNRWALGASDICFTNPLYSLFFTLGQTLPVNRHAPFTPRGITQPSVTHAISLLNPPYNSWVHIFPEGGIWQAPNLPMRFFKMGGISRLILEPEITPIVIPMFHSGMETVMRELRVPPQFLPSTGKDICVRFGEAIPLSVLEPLRERWRKCKEHPVKSEVRKLRLETAEMAREAVNKVRESMGYPEEPEDSNDPKSFPQPDVPTRKDVKGWFKRMLDRVNRR